MKKGLFVFHATCCSVEPARQSYAHRVLQTVRVCDQFERAHGEEHSSVLLDAGAVLLAYVAADWGCDEVVLRNFLIQIDRLYQKQPYHNAKHGTLVSPYLFRIFLLFLF